MTTPGEIPIVVITSFLREKINCPGVSPDEFSIFLDPGYERTCFSKTLATHDKTSSFDVSSATSFIATALPAGGPHSCTLEATSNPSFLRASNAVPKALSKANTSMRPRAKRSSFFFRVTLTVIPGSVEFFTSKVVMV